MNIEKIKASIHLSILLLATALFVSCGGGEDGIDRNIKSTTFLDSAKTLLIKNPDLYAG